MFSLRWRLCKLAGIPISIDVSWLIILVLLTASMSGVFMQLMPGLAAASYWVMGLSAALAFFTCILLHELGHAVAARSMGMRIGGITLFLFGGVAEMEEEPPSALKEFVMAIAGPVVTVILAAGLWVLAAVGDQTNWNAPTVLVLEYLAGLNLAVLIFNMVPAFPLDGGRVLRSLLWGTTGKLRKATYWASLSGRVFSWLLIGVGVLFFVNGAFLGGMWLVLIALFLNSAAQNSYRQVVVREMLAGEPVSRFMNHDPIVVSPFVNLYDWVEDYVYRYHHKTFPVASNGLVEGYITTSMLGGHSRNEWEFHTVGEVMRQDLETFCIPPETDALEALEKMRRTGLSRLLVTQNNQLLGMVSLKDLLRFLDLKLELERSEDDHYLPAEHRRSTQRELLEQR